jgi:hypothetical protein
MAEAMKAAGERLDRVEQELGAVGSWPRAQP